MVIPVIEGATGTISESFRKYLNNILEKHETKELQKTVIHITDVQKVRCKSTEHST
jgi:hypothetical protein